MSFKILYSELQPCVLVACECKAKEPFLLMIRALNQTVRCGFCNTEYSIEVASYAAQSPEASEQRPANGLKIKCTPPPTAMMADEQAPRH
jgi:hypothetical protein